MAPTSTADFKNTKPDPSARCSAARTTSLNPSANPSSTPLVAGGLRTRRCFANAVGGWRATGRLTSHCDRRLRRKRAPAPRRRRLAAQRQGRGTRAKRRQRGAWCVGHGVRPTLRYKATRPRFQPVRIGFACGRACKVSGSAACRERELARLVTSDATPPAQAQRRAVLPASLETDDHIGTQR